MGTGIRSTNAISADSFSAEMDGIPWMGMCVIPFPLPYSESLVFLTFARPRGIVVFETKTEESARSILKCVNCKNNFILF
jgi:hypothetical protein